MKKLALLSLAVVGAVAANAQSVDHDNLNAGLLQSWTIDGAREFGGNDDTAAYANLTSFTGQASINGGATGGITKMVMDDITPGGGGSLAGQQASRIVFSVANLNTVAVSARVRLRFWFADGPGGNPGTYYMGQGYTFNPITFGAGSANLYQFTPTGFVIPAGAIWAGMTFDNVSGTATDAQLNNLGQLLYSTPTAGSSQDVMFSTTAAGSFFGTNLPAGSQFNFGGNPKANVGYQIDTVPEPGTVAAMAAGLGVLALRRRRK